MKYCCEPFYNSLQNAGNKGFAILLTSRSDILMYLIQVRICDSENENQLRTVIQDNIPQDQQFPLIVQKRISFCPFCGKKLINLMLPSSTEAKELIQKHINFVVK